MSFLDCPDQKFLYVPQGLGAPTGLSVLEHCLWGKGQDHPDATKLEYLEVDEDLKEVMEFEKEHSVEEIDEFRRKKMDEFVYLVA